MAGTHYTTTAPRHPRTGRSPALARIGPQAQVRLARLPRAHDQPLPATPHLPGTGTTPAHALLARGTQAAPSRTDAAAWARNATYVYGWRLFAAGCFWEAHEMWEVVWLRCRPNSRERLLLQLLIQIANASLKRRLARPRAARRILARAEALWRELHAGDDGRALMGVALTATEDAI